MDIIKKFVIIEQKGINYVHPYFDSEYEAIDYRERNFIYPDTVNIEEIEFLVG